MSWFRHDIEERVNVPKKQGYQPTQGPREDLEKQREKQLKQEKQKMYQDELRQQVRDKTDRKQAQKDYDDSQKYGGFFNSGVPRYTRDITNSEESEALELEKRNRKEKQELYARELAAQLEESNIKKASERSQRRQTGSVGPRKDQRETAEQAKQEKLQNQRDYADSLQEHINLQNMLKQQLRDKEQQYENQFGTGLDIRGAYKYTGPTQEQVREELARQIQEKEYLKQRDYENQAEYEREERLAYEQYQKPVYGKKVSQTPTDGEKLDIFGNPAYVGGKSSNAKENVALDIFGNPSRQPSQKSSKPLNYDLDIFGNPSKRR